MSRSAVAISISGGLLCGGCDIHPLPHDVTGLKTPEIVAQVRCEVRSAIMDRVDYAIRRREYEVPPSQANTPNRVYRDAHLADDLKNGVLAYRDLFSKITDPDLKAVFERYKAATIAYEFSLDMTEANNASANATLTRPFKNGGDTIGFSLASDHKRQNTRTFTIDDNFFKLISETDEGYCANTAKYPNFNYPITGQTKLSDTVVTFLTLNQSGNLGMKTAGPKTPTLTDDLQFTTTYTGSVSPGFNFTPVGRVLAFSNVGGRVEDSRSDIHRVTVALAMPEKGKALTPQVIAETRKEAREALQNASNNRFQIYLQKISNGLTAPAAQSSFLSRILP